MWLIACLLLAMSTAGTPPAGNQRGLDKEQVRQVMRDNMRGFITCFEVQANKGVDISPRVDVSFVIAPDGKPTRVTARGINAELERCVVRVVTTFAFPKSRATTRVHYPLRVHPAGN